MIKLEKLSLEEISEKVCYVEQLMELYENDLSGEFYKYTYNGEERWLYCLNGYCTILSNDGEYILYTSFYVDRGDYSLIYMEFDKFNAGVDNGEILLWREGDNISESLRTLDRSAMENNEGYSGLVIHHQKNVETGEDLLVSYQNQYREDGRIFSCNLQRPFVICFVDGKKITKYLNYRTNRDYLTYDMITIKEYGLSEFLKQGSYALQKEYEIRRYFKIRYQMSDGTCILGVPFSKCMTEEEMKKMIEDKGFRLEVPQYVIDYYNGEYEECNEYKELAEALKQFDLEHSEDKKLSKVGGVE